MRTRPDGVGERELRLALAEGRRIDAAAMRYAAVGGGSYHWAVRDSARRRWFVTVDDLDDKRARLAGPEADRGRRCDASVRLLIHEPLSNC